MKAIRMKIKVRQQEKRREHAGKMLLIIGFILLLIGYTFGGLLIGERGESQMLIVIVFTYSILYGGLLLLPEPSWLMGLDYLKKCGKQIFAVVGIFLCAMLFAFILPNIFSFIDIFLEELIKKTEGLSASGLINFIFLNNARTAFYGLFGGILLGIFPLANALTNGAILGYVFARVYEISGASDFWRILPHGIFELPAIFIALGLGLKLGMFIFGKYPGKGIREGFWNSLRVFLLIVVPLLIIAAIIEGVLIALIG